MGSIFRPKTTVVNVPSQSQAQGSSKIEPFEPVVPFIKEQLPDLVNEFWDRVHKGEEYFDEERKCMVSHNGDWEC